MLRVGVLRDQHGAGDENAADAKSGDNAPDQQFRHGGRCGGEEQSGAVDRDRGQQQRTSAEPIGEGPDGGGSERHADETAGEQEPQLLPGEVEIGRHGVRRKRHRLDVVAIQGHQRRRQRDDEPLVCVHRPRVDLLPEGGVFDDGLIPAISRLDRADATTAIGAAIRPQAGACRAQLYARYYAAGQRRNLGPGES